MEKYQLKLLCKALLCLVVSFCAINASPVPIQIQQEDTPEFRPNEYKVPAFIPISEDTYKTAASPNFIMNYQQLTKNGAEIVNVRPSRRTILSTLMQPFMQMREQAANMLATTLQSCNGGNFGSQSLWCRFWGMFF